MKTNYLKKWWAVALMMLTMGVAQVSAQATYLVVENGALKATMGAGTNLQLNTATSGTTTNSKRVCTSQTSGNVACLQINTNTTGYFEMSAPSTSGYITNVSFDMVASNSSGSGWAYAVWYSKEVPFNTSKAYRIDWTLLGDTQGCGGDGQSFDLSGLEAKSFRVYRQVRTQANSDGTTYTIGLSSGGTQVPSSSAQSVNFRQVQATVTPACTAINTNFNVTASINAVCSDVTGAVIGLSGSETNVRKRM